MNRKEIIQSIIDKKGLKNYLEIGVSGGEVFFQIKCKRKVAVDPKFVFNWKYKIIQAFKNKYNATAKYFEVTSDDFFTHKADKIYKKSKVQLVFVDGMHEFKYSLNDILNSLNYLAEDGIILVHDCNPLTQEAACSFEEYKKRGYTGFWNGDVWKSIYYIKQNRNDLNVFVLDCEHGMGVICRNGSEFSNHIKYSYDEIDSIPYSDFESNRSDYLNLKSPEYFKHFLNTLS